MYPRSDISTIRVTTATTMMCTPQSLLLGMLKGDAVCKEIYQKLQYDIGGSGDNAARLNLGGYVTPNTNKCIWYSEKDLAGEYRLTLYANMTLFQMKRMLKVCPNPSISFSKRGNHIDTPRQFEEIVNSSNPKHFKMYDFVPHLRWQSKRQIQPDAVYRLNDKIRLVKDDTYRDKDDVYDDEGDYSDDDDDDDEDDDEDNDDEDDDDEDNDEDEDTDMDDDDNTTSTIPPKPYSNATVPTLSTSAYTRSHDNTCKENTVVGDKRIETRKLNVQPTYSVNSLKLVRSSGALIPTPTTAAPALATSGYERDSDITYKDNIFVRDKWIESRKLKEQPTSSANSLDVLRSSLDGTDIISLDGQLTNVVIDLYIFSLIEREDKLDKIRYVVSHRWDDIESLDYWTDNIKNYEALMTPVNYNNGHWILLIFEYKTKKLFILDSINNSNNHPFIKKLNRITSSCSRTGSRCGCRSGSGSCTEFWNIISYHPGLIQQERGSHDCGIFTVLYAESYIRYGNFDKVKEKAINTINGTIAMKTRQELKKFFTDLPPSG